MKKFSFSEFKKIYSKVPRLTVEIILKTNKGIVLTLREFPPCKGQWHIPGGTVLKGENLEEAVRRVVKEEIGLEVKVKKMIGIIEYNFTEKYFSQPIGIAYLVKSLNNNYNIENNKRKFFKKLPLNLIKDQRKFLKEKFDFK